MVTDQTRRMIWQDLVDSERHVRYYDKMADMYSRRHKRMRFGILMSALAEATIAVGFTNLDISGIWAILVFGVIILVGLVIAVLVTLEATSDYAEHAALLGWMSLDCKLYNVQWVELWHDVYTNAIGEGKRGEDSSPRPDG